MQVVTSVDAARRWAKGLKEKKVPIGFVPTMGYLHDGHISLVHRARREVGPRGRVAVSIYVNPTQFAPHEDLARYPRDLARDRRLCREAGVDLLFVPGDASMYPPGFSTYVVEENLSRRMEGVSRPTHFRGVTTVVAKLFNILLPDVAVFGAKDFQQASVIRKMTRDLNFPVKIVMAPTHREPDGIAMSSRNKYLTPAQRLQATVLSRCLRSARDRVKFKNISATSLRSEMANLISDEPECRLDYVEFFDPATLQPSKTVKRGTQMALAVFIGKTRLIDNLEL